MKQVRGVLPQLPVKRRVRRPGRRRGTARPPIASPASRNIQARTAPVAGGGQRDRAAAGTGTSTPPGPRDSPRQGVAPPLRMDRAARAARPARPDRWRKRGWTRASGCRDRNSGRARRTGRRAVPAPARLGHVRRSRPVPTQSAPGPGSSRPVARRLRGDPAHHPRAWAGEASGPTGAGRSRRRCRPGSCPARRLRPTERRHRGCLSAPQAAPAQGVQPPRRSQGSPSPGSRRRETDRRRDWSER